MAQRDDITVRWDLSPRLITIDAPSTEITVQDLHDTLRELESQQQNLIYPSIIETAGGEDLGGSVTVGLTATLQNACVSFEPRTDSIADGYATGIDSTGTVLTDASAMFVSDAIERGALIINFDDFSAATVIQIISETQLELEPLNDGITDTWDISPGDYYKIWNQVTCNITGGNLVAVDENGLSIDPVCPTAMVQVVRSSASSATSTFSQDIEFASFNGGVTVDPNNVSGRATGGITFPTGTARQPCLNLTDALTIANLRGFFNIYILGNATIDSGLNFANFSFIGDSISRTACLVTSAAQVSGCSFENMTFSGTLNGYSTVRNCDVSDLDFFNGNIINSGISGTILLAGNAAAKFDNCHDSAPGSETPIIDMGSSGQSLNVVNWTGGITIKNKSGLDPITIDIDPGRVVLENTVTSGDILVRGIGSLEDNSAGATVDSINLIEGIKIQRLAYRGQVHVNAIPPDGYGHIPGVSGTTPGIHGIPSNPVNNITDAFTIGEAIGLLSINLVGTSILDRNRIDWSFSSDRVGALVPDGYFVDYSSLKDIFIIGSFGLGSDDVVSGMVMEGCKFINAGNVKGIATNSILIGSLQVHPTSDLILAGLKTDERPAPWIINLGLFAFPIPPPTLDVNGSNVTVQNLDGYLILENVNDIDSTAVISADSAEIYISPSCTNGDIIIRGNAKVVNAGASNLNTTGNVSSSSISSEVFNKLFPFTSGAQ